MEWNYLLLTVTQVRGAGGSSAPTSTAGRRGTSPSSWPNWPRRAGSSSGRSGRGWRSPGGSTGSNRLPPGARSPRRGSISARRSWPWLLAKQITNVHDRAARHRRSTSAPLCRCYWRRRSLSLDASVAAFTPDYLERKRRFPRAILLHSLPVYSRIGDARRSGGPSSRLRERAGL